VPRRGLPDTIAMRHDEHYVDALAASAGAPIGRLIGIDQIDPNPNQPRQVMGDLSELIASISEKGILEPLVVRPRGARFQIVAGERRYQAAVQAGLRELGTLFVGHLRHLEVGAARQQLAAGNVPSVLERCADAVGVGGQGHAPELRRPARVVRYDLD